MRRVGTGSPDAGARDEHGRGRVRADRDRLARRRPARPAAVVRRTRSTRLPTDPNRREPARDVGRSLEDDDGDLLAVTRSLHGLARIQPVGS